LLTVSSATFFYQSIQAKAIQRSYMLDLYVWFYDKLTQKWHCRRRRRWTDVQTFTSQPTAAVFFLDSLLHKVFIIYPSPSDQTDLRQ